MVVNRVKKILYMGCYIDNVNRNAIFLEGLKNNAVSVYEYNVISHNIIKNISLFFKNFKKLKSENFDLVLFHSEVFIQFILAVILARIKNIPLIHDIFISKLQTIYEDRQQYNFKRRKMPKLLFRILLFTIDLIECTFADYIILDTYSHIKFFHEKFNTPIKKFSRIFVGSQNSVFFPLPKEKKDESKFIVGFCGTYIQLQGIKYIIKSAKILKNENQIKFVLIGNGQTFYENRNLARELKLTNIEFIDFVPLVDLPRLKSNFDIELGIFGDTDKTLQVIPNKVFDGIAMKFPMITCDSPAIRELFTDNENIILCNRADPESLARAIMKLKHDPDLRQKISKNAFEIYNKYCSIEAIGKKLLRTLNKILLKNKN